MKLTIKNKLLLGFSAIVVIIILLSMINLVKLNSVREIELSLTELRFPTVTAGMQLVDGVHLSLSGLRGYMILGKDIEKAKQFKIERLNGWEQIDESLNNMQQFSTNWTEPKNIEMLKTMKDYFEEFREAQQEIEDIIHKPENIPSIDLMLNEATPRAAKIITAITAIIDEEKLLAASKERKHLLTLLADSRGSFALGMANIRAYLLSGDVTFIPKFKAQWKINEARYNEIASLSKLFNKNQSQNWITYKTNRAKFSTLPNIMLELRRAKDWNLANYWLATKAAPKAKLILEILSDMRKSQDELAAIDKELFISESNSMKNIMLLGMVVAILLSIIISTFIARMISKPLNRVVIRAQEISEGDLTGVQLPIEGNDEITDLSRSINIMSSNLNELILEISESVDQVASAAEELSTTATETGYSVTEQQSQIEQVAIAMNQMTATISEITTNVASTAKAADDANSETISGRKEVEQAIMAIEQLSRQLEATAETIQQLEQNSENINAVLEVIRGVADQTNLLSLNAAIEAARAGEQGRGFAVVADEVRTLAGRTQQSTEEINQVIDKLQTDSKNTVIAMDNCQNEAISVVEQANKAGRSLVSISKAVEQIHGMSNQISSATEEQYKAAEDVNNNIISITDTSSETTLAVKQIMAASSDLSKLSSTLFELVSRFKVRT
ncbi:MAG: hypothetical protein COA74_12620 [Gammaproteobacteria bacterium]|nr:MAG: hypothetical protein COA74_15160 [Gammaproteobacteria bacterium]PCJ46893.1 MAG: hypothetical protein COA74_12620 [Gammaproteobacteria bacterium]